MCLKMYLWSHESRYCTVKSDGMGRSIKCIDILCMCGYGLYAVAAYSASFRSTHQSTAPDVIIYLTGISRYSVLPFKIMVLRQTNILLVSE